MKVLYKILFLLLIIIGVSSCKSPEEIVNQDEIKKRIKDSIATTASQQNTVSPVQKKYAAILGVSPKEIRNVELFNFIDEWMNTPYKLGGETKRGIDCSFFSQYLFHDVYGNLIERTAQKQYDAPSTDKFVGQQFLRQGDLVFFNLEGSQAYPISHVGVYLGHNKFVHSTARKSTSGRNGVQISDFTKRHWQKLFVAAGRKPKTPKTTNK